MNTNIIRAQLCLIFLLCLQVSLPGQNTGVLNNNQEKPGVADEYFNGLIDEIKVSASVPELFPSFYWQILRDNNWDKTPSNFLMKELGVVSNKYHLIARTGLSVMSSIQGNEIKTTERNYFILKHDGKYTLLTAEDLSGVGVMDASIVRTIGRVMEKLRD